MKRSRIVLAALIPMLFLGGMGSFWIVGTRVTPVTVDDVVERFRATTPSVPATPPVQQDELRPEPPVAAGGAEDRDPSAAIEDAEPTSATAAHDVEGPSAVSAPTRPEAGVYVYRTTGYEEVSFGVGAEHRYPDETTITVTHTACGSDVRWDALEERWAEWSHCAPDGTIDLRRFVSHHEFFGQVEERAVACDSPTLIRIAGDVPGTVASSRCEGHGIVAELTTEVVEQVMVDVDGESVGAVHVRVDQVLSGEARGTRSSDLWLARSNGMLIRLADSTDMDVDAVFGATQYREEFEIALTSTTPLR